MRTVKSGVILVIGIGTLLAGFGMVRVLLGQGDDDLSIISEMTTTTQRKNFFRTLTPERKTALWRKHLAVELTKHPELTADQKSVINLGMVIVSPDFYTANLPNVCSKGSVFGTALENAFPN